MPEASLSEEFARRTVLVTGSSRGVGRIVAEHFLSQGAVVIGVSRGRTELVHGRYEHRQVDLGDPDGIRSLFRSLRTDHFDVDVVINSAGVLTSQYAMILPTRAAQEMVAIDLLAPFFVAREAAKGMRKVGWGRIVNIGSMAAVLEPPGDSVYAACKAGLETMTNVLAKEFASLNITCNTLGISAFETDMLRQLPREKVDSVVGGLPMPKYATQQDIQNVLDFFVSENSGGITAQTLYLGGVH